MYKCQLLSVVIAVIGIIAFTLVFFMSPSNQSALYLFGGLTLLGLAGNAVFSVLRVRDSWYGKS